MDDFAIFADSQKECLDQFKALENLLGELGFLVHPEGAGESKRSGLEALARLGLGLWGGGELLPTT